MWNQSLAAAKVVVGLTNNREFEMRHLVLTVAAVSAALVASNVLAVGPAINPADHTQFNENAYYNGFGGPLPAGIIEGSSGFSTIGDYSGRTTALAAVTSNPFDAQVLTTINTGLFSGSDVNVYKIKVVNPATFSASVPSTSLILSLFDSTGTAVASTVGNALSLTNGVVTTPGQYYLAIANSQNVAQNASGQALFNGQVALTTTPAGIYLPNLLNSGGTALAGTPSIAFSIPAAATTGNNNLLTNTSFTAGGSTITLAGANYSVPEPATLTALAGVAAVGMIRRRRSI